jgi:PIN domain nuclease of toxin-antitoxin system
VSTVLDASAILAYTHKETGSEVVRAALNVSFLSSVNWAEVVQKTVARGTPIEGMRQELEELGMRIPPFTPEDAEMAGRLWMQARSLSLGDRACISLGHRLHLPVLTADRAWVGLNLDVDIHILR